MRIKKLHIRNFKSLVDFELEDLKPFCAFVGPNASGKSNIFEALEFTYYVLSSTKFTNSNRIDLRYFGGNTILSFNAREVTSFGGVAYGNMRKTDIGFYLEFDNAVLLKFYIPISETDNLNPRIFPVAVKPDSNFRLGSGSTEFNDVKHRQGLVGEVNESSVEYRKDYNAFVDNFGRVFIGKPALLRFPVSPGRLAVDGSNLSQIIGTVFENKDRRTDFVEWLRILIPEFKDIDVKRSNIDGSYNFFIYEKGTERPFPRNLISDGTYNILSLMAAVYQSNQPQFLCIEEPENGLHPQAIELLVDFFREKCEEEGHHIWLNTHSQTLVRCLEIDEIILVDKVDGATRAKQLTKEDEVNIKTDEAWLSNALGGGVL
jgi:energy-coupling factor transporter ATP-binding protein EcfA2